MRTLLVLISAILFLLSACRLEKGSVSQSGDDSSNLSGNTKVVKSMGDRGSDGEEPIKLQVPGPMYIGYQATYTSDELVDVKKAHLWWLARSYSNAAYFHFYFFGTFPDTLEQIEELGLVPYTTSDANEYTFVKDILVLNGYYASPSRRDEEGNNLLELVARQPFDQASPETIMQVKSMELLWMFEEGREPDSIMMWKVLLPGIEDIGWHLRDSLVLNEKFFTNPFTNRPMQQVTWDNPQPGDFSVRTNEKGLYEVKLHS